MDLFFLEKLYHLFEIPIVVCDTEQIYYQIPEKSGYESIFETDPEWRKQLCSVTAESERPIYYLEMDSIYYGAIKEKDARFVFVGPFSPYTVDERRKKEFCNIHQIPFHSFIPKCGTKQIAGMLVLIGYEYTGKRFSEDDIYLRGKDENKVYAWSIENDIEQYQLEQSEYNRSHSVADYETKLLEIVRRGDLKALQKWSRDDTGEIEQIGVVARDNKKQAEYLEVSLITLLTRTAIEGGMNPEKAYQLGDVYMQRLEKCQTLSEYSMLGVRAEYEFTEAVKKAIEKRSRYAYVEQCKDYIAQNLRKPFKVGDIAPVIGVNRTYLAKKFMEVEGITVQQYIMKERCEHAANLLKYSDYSIPIIAEYFCFSSQSHFGIQFKKYYHMTPNQYRNQNRYIESHEYGLDSFKID